MKLKEAIKILKIHNYWRRGKIDTQTDAKMLGVAIDTIVEHYEKTKGL